MLKGVLEFPLKPSELNKKAQPVTAPEKVKIEPVITPNIQPDSGFQVKSGWYHLIKLDANGQELFGTDVSVHPNTYTKTFQKLTEGESPTYKVKKNPK
jgi:hypothetical protein